ncbi:unnamed protein product [Dracunculus medinensis]|uniref:Cleavage and polyadenylation specificity factor subunit 4 n=1 Tax=Dracunculus medinensis TaxID=318479 RepID=A0A0N4U857_DRAME|nr:unnamed protein product [Dracunculus medinensis]
MAVATTYQFNYDLTTSNNNIQQQRNIYLTIDDYMADISCPLLDVEEMLLQQRGCREASFSMHYKAKLTNRLLMNEVPFSGMDKSGRGVCLRNEKGTCVMGAHCPLRHIVGDKAVVCKHWLRGLCKKGDQCEFLHEYDLSKMPECFFFSKYMACSNRECPFRHIDPESKIKDCPWYDRGFCRHGPFCKNRHRRRVLCPNYLAGFCLEGHLCKYAHPSFNIPPLDASALLRTRGHYNMGIICHNCHERGHKATFCPHLPTQTQPSVAEPVRVQSSTDSTQPNLADNKHFQKALSDVTCYKCGEKGHYANRCHKGVLAFLSNTAHLAQEQREKDEKEARLVINIVLIKYPLQAFYGGFGNRPQPPSQPQVLTSNNKPGEMLSGENHAIVDNENSKVVEKLVKSTKIEIAEVDGTAKNVTGGYKIQLKSLSPYITCPICHGYFIEATTVTECLHTFCKSCLLKHFEDENNCCPKCNGLIHQSHPSHYVSFDRTMQELVYKLVPGLQAREEESRRAFGISEKNDSGEKQILKKEENNEEKVEHKCNGDIMKNHHRGDDQVVIELCPDSTDFQPIEMPIVRLSEMASISTVKRYLALALFGKMNRYNELDIFCNNELMGRDYSMKFIAMTRWREKAKDVPIQLFFRKHVDY